MKKKTKATRTIKKKRRPWPKSMVGVDHIPHYWVSSGSFDASTRSFVSPPKLIFDVPPTEQAEPTEMTVSIKIGKDSLKYEGSPELVKDAVTKFFDR